MTLTSILNSYFLQVVIDRLIPTKATTTLTIIACGLLIAYVFNSLFLYIREFSLTILGQRLSVNIVLSYVRHVLKLPMEFFATHKTGDILARFTDSNKIIDALASTVISMFLDVGTVLVIGWVLALQNLRLFGLTLLAIPLYVLVIFSFTSRFEKLNRQVMESNSLVSASIIENIQGIETLKALNSERVRYHKIDKQFKRLLSNSLNYVKVDTLQQAIKIFIQALLTTLILWYGANLVITDSISLGQLMAYNALLSYFLSPLQNIINLQTKLQSAQVANKRLNEIFYIDSEFKLERPITDSQTLVGPIKFQLVKVWQGDFGDADLVVSRSSLRRVLFEKCSAWKDNCFCDKFRNPAQRRWWDEAHITRYICWKFRDYRIYAARWTKQAGYAAWGNWCMDWNFIKKA